MIKKFQYKKPFEAFQYNGKNADELEKWLDLFDSKKNLIYNEDRTRIRLLENYYDDYSIPLGPTDWIFVLPDGNFNVLENKEMELYYEEVD